MSKENPYHDNYETVGSGICPHCGLSYEEHDDSGMCPSGTEEFGGRR